MCCNNISSADKALGNWKPTAKQPITESNWNLLLRYSHVDKARSPAAQGYQIVDEVKALPSGPMKRRHDPLMIGSGGEAGEKDSDGKNNIPVGKLASVNSSYSGTNLASKTLWSDQEINELVRLRCHGLTYPAIAKVGFLFLDSSDGTMVLTLAALIGPSAGPRFEGHSAEVRQAEKGIPLQGAMGEVQNQRCQNCQGRRRKSSWRVIMKSKTFTNHLPNDELNEGYCSG